MTCFLLNKEEAGFFGASDHLADHGRIEFIFMMVVKKTIDFLLDIGKLRIAEST